jgi:hypothetical protein
MIHIPITNSHQTNSNDCHNLNAGINNELASIENQDSSNSPPPALSNRILVSICAGLCICAFVASNVSGSSVQAIPGTLDSINIKTNVPMPPVLDPHQTLAQSDVCVVQYSIEEAEIAVALSQAQLIQANINLQEFHYDYKRYSALALRGKVTKQQLVTATSAFNLAQLQKSSAIKGLQDSKAQLNSARKAKEPIEISANKSDLMPTSNGFT